MVALLEETRDAAMRGVLFAVRGVCGCAGCAVRGVLFAACCVLCACCLVLCAVRGVLYAVCCSRRAVRGVLCACCLVLFPDSLPNLILY